MPISRTIIISCAGMGNRLGLCVTKALIEVDDIPLIIRHLEALKNEKDIRIVIGYQAEKVIDVVKSYRKDVLFVFNHNYKNTGTGASVSLAAKYLPLPVTELRTKEIDTINDYEKAEAQVKNGFS